MASRSGSADRVSVSFVSRGHPNVTGTHDKTLEITRDVEISRRATCVLGVAAEHDDRALLALRGSVEVTLECDGVREVFTATMSPFFLGDASLVFRRGPGLRGRTVAFDATKTAATVSRDLIAKLQSSESELHVTITAVGSEPTVGALYVVSLPIGNDGDIGRRAIEVLERVDLVLAEDTRRLRALAQRVGIEVARVTSYHDHNESERVESVLQRLHAGGRVALVSDAGTPLLSDPGYVVVSRAVAEDIPVCPVPGPSAALAALAASGLPVDRFVFGGFLPRRSAARRQAVQQLSAPGFAIVVYEAAPRVAETLADIAAVIPDWSVCLGREVTKTFEEFRYGNVADIASEIRAEKLLGECTLVVAPPTAADTSEPAPSATDAQLDDLLRSLLAQGVPSSTLAQALRVLPGIGRNQAYERVRARPRVADAMTITRVVGKGRTSALAAEAFAELQAGYSSTVVDVGTGDGRYAYQLASGDAQQLIIGLDALAENMGERAATAARKPAKGGRANLVYVHAAIETLPPELASVADAVHVLLPWGRLLEGIVLAHADVLSGIASLCRPGAQVSVTLNGEIWIASTPTRYEQLPVPTPEYVAEVIAPGFASVGIVLDAARYSTAEEAKQLGTTWARKLGHGRDHPCFVQFEGVSA